MGFLSIANPYASEITVSSQCDSGFEASEGYWLVLRVRVPVLGLAALSFILESCSAFPPRAPHGWSCVQLGFLLVCAALAFFSIIFNCSVAIFVNYQSSLASLLKWNLVFLF